MSTKYDEIDDCLQIAKGGEVFFGGLIAHWGLLSNISAIYDIKIEFKVID